MAKQEVSAQQVQMAAAAGVKLLQVEDLPVPLSVAKSGALGVLDGMLQAIANGEVILAQPPVPENNLGNVGAAPIAPVDPSAGASDAANESGNADPAVDPA
jgi:hypothetical protein